MGAFEGEKCGWCATPQHAGALICRSCSAERRVTKDRSRKYDKTITGVCLSVGFFFLFSKEFPWWINTAALILPGVIGNAIDSIPSDVVNWHR